MIVIEVVENGRPAQYVFKDYESMKIYVKSKGFKSYKIIRADEGSITASEMLKEKYGLSEEELRELVKNAKSQPEAIARVKARVKRWDWTLERLVSHMWSYERWKREDKTIASQVERELKKSLRIATGITKKTGVPREIAKKKKR